MSWMMEIIHHAVDAKLLLFERTEILGTVGLFDSRTTGPRDAAMRR
jgi:hypothetical protein